MQPDHDQLGGTRQPSRAPAPAHVRPRNPHAPAVVLPTRRSLTLVLSKSASKDSFSILRQQAASSNVSAADRSSFPGTALFAGIAVYRYRELTASFALYSTPGVERGYRLADGHSNPSGRRLLKSLTARRAGNWRRFRQQSLFPHPWPPINASAARRSMDAAMPLGLTL